MGDNDEYSKDRKYIFGKIEDCEDFKREATEGLKRLPVIEATLLRMESKLDNGLNAQVAENSACLRTLATLPTQVAELASKFAEIDNRLLKLVITQKTEEKKTKRNWERIGIGIALIGVLLAWLDKLGVF